MNKYLRSFKSLNNLGPKFCKFSFSTKNSNDTKERSINTYLDKITEQINDTRDQQLKSLYQNIDTDNYGLTCKIRTILETGATDEMKTISLINEINKVNIKNTEQLLGIHQNYVFNYNYRVIKMILVTYEKILRIFSPASILMIIGIYIGYQQIKKKIFISNNVEAKDVVKFYRENPEKLFKVDSILPAFFDHKNLTNLIANGKQFMLIGPKGIGKTYSVKHFCMLEAQKDSIVLYKDLNYVENIDNIYEFICSNLLEFYIKQNQVNVEVKYNEILDEIKERKVFFVLDNFLNNPKLLSSVKKVIDVLKSYNVNIIILTDNNNYNEFAYEGKMMFYKENFQVKSVDEKLEEKFNNYLLENVNHMMRSNPKFSNCELFSENNIKELRNNYHVTFNSVVEYLNTNTSIKDYLNEQNHKLLQKLRFLNSNNPEMIQILKETFKLQKKPQEWIKIKDSKHYNHILSLEKNNLIAIRNIDEIRILNPIIRDLVNKI